MSEGDKGQKSGKSRLRKSTKFSGHPMDTIIIITVIVLGYIAAFAWRDAADQAFNFYFPDDGKGSFKPRIIYATVATVVAIIVIMGLSKIK